MSRLIALHGTASSVVLECGPSGAPLWRYWGPLLPAQGLPAHTVAQARYVPPSSLECEVPASLLPSFGVGGFGQPALLAHRAGLDFAQDFNDCVLDRRADTLTITLSDRVARLQVVIELSLDADDVLRIRSRLRNDGDAVLDLQWLASATLPLPAHARQVSSAHGQWSNEFRWQDEALGPSVWLRENHRGRTGHDGLPAALVLAEGATAHAGTVWAAQLAWSGNSRQQIAPREDGGWLWQLGEWLAPGEVRLAPGECFETPEVVATCSTGGRNGAMRNFHAAARATVRWPGGQMAPRPVHLNTWEAVYFDHDEAALRELAQAAAAVGVERFVLDDGWFHGRRDDARALGDWWPDAAKYPKGLTPLAEQVQALGMQFGLWVEPEMVSPDSALFRAHPDWALQLAGRPLLTARQQLVLDLARPEVAEHLFTTLNGLLHSLPIAYLKWDMNRDLTTAGHAGRAAYHGQVQALYALLARLAAAHPAVEIESCASGGARIDLGVLPHVQRFWTSDNNDARSRVAIQRGALQLMPPELLGAHVGAERSHTTGRSQSLAFRAAVALPLHLGVEADVRRLAPEQAQALARWIALYKQLRPRLHGVPVTLGEAGDGIVWQAHGDATAAVLFVYRLEPTAQRFSPALRMPWLAAERPYRLRRLCAAAQGAMPGWGRSALHDELDGPGAVLPGAWLREAGLELPRLTGESALILSIDAQ
ncbi:alpha-galactosidase [Ideonella sp.]|uniref:alpha-galactosidase n=1 Tax=Ideonella sp. TaxID=1929293 RepID=UPI003BB736F8